MVMATIAATLVAAGALLYALRPAAGALDSIRVSPAAVLFTAPGESRRLVAEGVDSAGLTVEVDAPRWTTTREATVTVTPDGTLSAIGFGSAQVIAEVDGVRSAPILVIVARPAAGVTLIADDQVVVDVAPLELEARPSFENLLAVTLKGPAPKVGDRLLGTGEREVAGEVVATAPEANGTRVTFRLVPLRELLPDLTIDEQFDLSDAEVLIPDDLARLYDVTRAGVSLTFTPKSNFDELVAQAARATSTWPRMFRDGDQFAAIDGPVGTTSIELGPFTCEGSSSTLPIQLANAPAISIELNPILDLDWANGSLRRFVVGGELKGTIAGGFKVTTAFERKWTCARDFYTITLPVGGPLAYFVGGHVPVGAAFEIAGKVTLASLELGTKVELTGAVELGLDCPTTCAFTGRTTGSATVTPTIDGPSLGDIRLEPSFTASATVKLQLGSRVWPALRWKFVEAKLGAKLAASWAPTTVQILDAAYKSDFKLTLEAGAGLNSDSLGDIAALFGLPSLAVAEVKSSLDLARSPVGALSTDKARYQAGEAVTATVTMDEEWLDFLTLYDVTRIRVVQYAGGVVTELGAQEATAGQKDFTITFAAPASMPATELHAFVTTKLPPLDFFGLELDRKVAGPLVLFSSNRGGRVDLYTVSPDGGEPTPVTGDAPQDTWPAWSPDHSRLLVVREGSQGSGIYVMNADGSGEQLLRKGAWVPAWSPDGMKIAFMTTGPSLDGLAYYELWIMNADGSGARSLTPGLKSSNTLPTWSPDSTRIAFVSDRDGSHHEIYVIRADGSGTEQLTNGGGYGPSWSPDGASIAFQCARNSLPQICIQNVDGSGNRFIDTAPVLATDPVWSPDGRRLAFTGHAGGNEDIYVVNVDGSGLVRLTDDPAADQMPSW